MTFEQHLTIAGMNLAAAVLAWGVLVWFVRSIRRVITDGMADGRRLVAEQEAMARRVSELADGDEWKDGGDDR